MFPCIKFETHDGQTFSFRQKHSGERYRGQSGIYAFTQIHEFTRIAKHFVAANDLAQADYQVISKTEFYNTLNTQSPVGVAVLLMPKSTTGEREHIAKALNDALRYYSPDGLAA